MNGEQRSSVTGEQGATVKLVIHHVATGRILRHGICHSDDVALQHVPDGHAVLVLPADHPPINDRRHQVQAGAIVAGPPVGTKAEAMAASRASKPAETQTETPLRIA